ncbi:hypothetical protein MHBO_000643, partial [Bonamia ostreae]
ILHTIGGDDTNMSAGDLSLYLLKNYNNYKLSVVGLPKTIDNDVVPIAQTLGAHTAAEQGALFFQNVVSELSSNPNMLIVHEIMGRNSGWLTAKTAQLYMQQNLRSFVDLVQSSKAQVHAIYLPEVKFNADEESARLKTIMAEQGCVNIFLSEGACSDAIVAEIESRGDKVERDAFGHVRLDTLNPGKWFGQVMAKLIGAEKVLVQKSGYFCRAAPAGAFDRDLVRRCAEKAVEFAMEGRTGLCGPDQEQEGEIGCIDYARVSGGKPFDLETPWFRDLVGKIGQRVEALNKQQNLPFFSYCPSDSATLADLEDGENGEKGSKVVSLLTASLLSVHPEETDAIRRLAYSANVKNSESICEIIFALMTCFKNTASACEDVECSDGSATFKNLVNSSFVQSLKAVKNVISLVSLEKNEPIPIKQIKNGFTVYLDPADGSSNIDTNAAIGSIFGIYEGDENKSLNKKPIVSGYCLYSSATILMLTFGNGVFGFTLDKQNNCFVLSHKNVKIPRNGKFYSVNEGYFNEWPEEIKQFVIDLKQKNKSLRYVGSLVADIHRTLLYGGIYFYPQNEHYPNGKLKLTTESRSIAHLIEQSDGRASCLNGEKIMDKKIDGIDDRETVAFGSPILVDGLIKACLNK